MSEEDFEYILNAIEFLAVYGQRFFPLYSFNLINGSWRLKTEKVEALTSEGNCNFGVHSIWWNESNFEVAKCIATRLPNFPSQGIIKEELDPNIFCFRV